MLIIESACPESFQDFFFPIKGKEKRNPVFLEATFLKEETCGA
jgi:hypothetical protein